MKKIRFSIRAKLLLLSIIILSIPYIGFEYLRELERYLRDSFETGLIDTARSMAAPLHEQASLFQRHADYEDQFIYAHDLTHPIEIDGYEDDWLSYISWSNIYPDNISGRDDGLSFRLITSHYQQYLYVLLQVKDNKVIYQRPDAPDTFDNDHVIWVFTRPDGELEHYYFSPSGPGKLRPFKFETYQDEYQFEHQKIGYVTNVTGEWQETSTGYNLEIVMPLDQVGERLGFIVSDVNNADTLEIVQHVGTAGENTWSNPDKLFHSSKELNRRIKTIGSNTGRRIWVLDNLGRVKASYGDLAKDLSENAVNIFYTLILPSVYERFRDDLAGASRLQGQEVLAALSGKEGTRWRSSPDGKAVIVSAAVPVWVDGEVRGTVVVEETTAGMQMLSRKAAASLFNKTLILFLIVTLALFLFASRLSYRIRRLSQEAERAIDEHGRVLGNFSTSSSNDEIGDLAKNYAAMLERLKEYNHYLENMSGRLSHELRTPIAVVQSSLEHLQANEIDEAVAHYLYRARVGIARLSLLVTRLSEATRLEQALQHTEKETIDIAFLLKNCVEGYRSAYPDSEFALHASTDQLAVSIAPDLFVQMLDKLIANAVDFSAPGRPIEIKLQKSGALWQIEIINYGSRLSDAMEGQLFNSMVSMRDDKDKKEPHLGLGLYIARLVAEYHGGVIRAENLSQSAGVRFCLAFS